MSGSLVPRTDFGGQLAELGRSIYDGQKDYERKQALTNLGVSPGDPTFLPKLGQALVGMGDINGALTISRLQAADQDRTFQRETSNRDFDFRKTESSRAQSNADRSFGAQQEGTRYDRLYQDRTANRADASLALQREAASRREYPAGYEADPTTGGQRPIRGGPQDPDTVARLKAAEAEAKGGTSVNPYAAGDSKFNGDQGKAAGFADRMLQSEQVLRKFEDINQGTFPADPRPMIAPFLPNAVLSSDRQQFEQARRDLANAQLRRESGAAIGPAEFESANKQYFPQPGDSPAVIAQKRANRRAATEAMIREGGPSYAPKMTFGEDGSIVPYKAPERPTRGQQASPQAAEQPRANVVPSIDAVPEGKRFRAPDGKIYRKVQGQAVPE